MNTSLVCPYCDRPLRWVPARWFGRGCFECDRCGEFPDLRETAPSRNLALHGQDATRPPKRDNRPRVLLVDDSEEHCDLYALMLEPTATVVTASHGEEALKIASSEPLDAIVLDVLMPGMDGWEVCSRLKASPITKDIPVILLTSLDGGELASRAHRAGAESVMMKPCAVERLAVAIDAAVRGHVRPAVHIPTARMAEALFQQAPHVTHTRRWARKTVTTALSAQLARTSAHVLNISYGGLCIEIEGESNSIPPSFDLTLRGSNLSIHAGAVWMCRGRGSWLCGAEVSQGTEEWRTLVDAIR